MSSKRPIIVLMTDFGLADPYVASVKGVILQHNPDVSLIDLTHEISPQNIIEASIKLKNTFSFFPEETIFVSVIDPGVGSDRAIVFVRYEQRYFIAPDNGLLSFIPKEGENVSPWFKYSTAKKLLNNNISKTFHGRDIMAPLAAEISLGSRLMDLGEIYNERVFLNFPEVLKKDREWCGEILYFDHFGNGITNIFLRNLNVIPVAIHIHNESIEWSYKGYGSEGRVVALENSSGYLEIAKSNGSARDSLKLSIGQPVRCSFE
jgi:S-adenosylmethionine hydrolase